MTPPLCAERWHLNQGRPHSGSQPLPERNSVFVVTHFFLGKISHHQRGSQPAPEGEREEMSKILSLCVLICHKMFKIIAMQK